MRVAEACLLLTLCMVLALKAIRVLYSCIEKGDAALAELPASNLWPTGHCLIGML
jgi:hypothetical protein